MKLNDLFPIPEELRFKPEGQQAEEPEKEPVGVNAKGGIGEAFAVAEGRRSLEYVGEWYVKQAEALHDMIHAASEELAQLRRGNKPEDITDNPEIKRIFDELRSAANARLEKLQSKGELPEHRLANHVTRAINGVPEMVATDYKLRHASDLIKEMQANGNEIPANLLEELRELKLKIASWQADATASVLVEQRLLMHRQNSLRSVIGSAFSLATNGADAETVDKNIGRTYQDVVSRSSLVQSLRKDGQVHLPPPEWTVDGGVDLVHFPKQAIVGGKANEANFIKVKPRIVQKPDLGGESNFNATLFDREGLAGYMEGLAESQGKSSGWERVKKGQDESLDRMDTYSSQVKEGISGWGEVEIDNYICYTNTTGNLATADEWLKNPKVSVKEGV